MIDSANTPNPNHEQADASPWVSAVVDALSHPLHALAIIAMIFGAPFGGLLAAVAVLG